MSVMKLNGVLFRNLCVGGLNAISQEEKKINGLNVFPVPDGDTGTNMKLTIEHGVNDSDSEANIGKFSLKLARGMLLGARGNSGVILSQIFKGISKYLKQFAEVNAVEFKDALISGYQTAYDAVVNPVEGTILTVCREGILRIQSLITEETSFEELFDLYINSMKKVLELTPELLPVLKEAGVIDSGGAGFIVIFEGMNSVLLNKELPQDISYMGKTKKILFDENSTLEYGYCTEFILQLLNSKCNIDEFDNNSFIEFLKTKGDSIICLKEDSIVKVHIHTMTPGVVMNEAQKYGEFINLKIENMQIEHNEVLEEKKKPKKKIAYICVYQGTGFKDLYEGFGIDILIDGGKTMNTSTEEFIEAMNQIDADDYVILPNNKNIYLAAMQAAKLKDEKHVHVIKTKSLVEAYFAVSLLDMDLNTSIDEQLRNLNTGLNNSHTFGVTMAVKDSLYNGIKIERGDFISVLDGEIILTSKTAQSAVIDGLRKVEGIDDKEVIILFRGKNLLEDEADEILDVIQNDYPNASSGCLDGDQDTYGVLIGIS
ncbi:MAG: DAK2 domain-containing protein [Acholeplasmatales bacterium]|nr:DAK2 domain-containing protein [Acholeplasmatales bacterium]